jgi:hypothetical protein
MLSPENQAQIQQIFYLFFPAPGIHWKKAFQKPLAFSAKICYNIKTNLNRGGYCYGLCD